MRKKGKSNRIDKTAKRSHSSDGTGDAVRGKRNAESVESSFGHGGAGAIVPRSSKEYMKQYYEKNKDKWAARQKQKRDEINAAKRKRYAEDAGTREYYKTHSKQYRKANPQRRRHVEISNRYGLTVDAYESMLQAQKNCCAICEIEFTKTPHVDHCHDSMKVRGLLCFNCNRAIGHFQDDTKIIRNAIKYLEER